MPLAKVQARGQVTLPRSIRKDMGCKPGDTLMFESTGDGAVEVRVLPRLSATELFQRYPIMEEIDEARVREEWQDIAARDVIKE